MSELWGALAQSAPAATTLTDIYEATQRGTVEAIFCNLGSAASVRLSQAIGGAADDPSQYLIYDAALAAGESKVTARITVKAGDVLRGYSDTGDVSININGIEESA